MQRFDFGERVSRAEAERRAGFELVDVGKPDAIFVRDGNVVSLVYGSVDEPRLVLTELRGSVWDGFVKKAAGPGHARRGGRASTASPASSSPATSTT